MAKKLKKQTSQARPRDSKGRFISVTKAVAKPTKKQPVQKDKDPKKVKAGKIRAQTAIKIKGKYASKILVNEVKRAILATKKVDVSRLHADNSKKIEELIKEAKITPAQVKKFFESKKFVFEDMLEKGGLTGTSKNSNQIEEAIEKYKGKIYLRNEKKKEKEDKKGNAKLEILTFINGCKSEFNCVDVAFAPFLSFGGKMIINLPNLEKFLKDLRKELELKQDEEISDKDGAEISTAIEKILTRYYGKEHGITFIIS